MMLKESDSDPERKEKGILLCGFSRGCSLSMRSKLPWIIKGILDSALPIRKFLVILLSFAKESFKPVCIVEKWTAFSNRIS